jgi:phosphatidate cytidylyltransferase
MSALILGSLIGDTWFAPYYPLFGLVSLAVAGVTSWELANLLCSYPMPIRRWLCVLGGVLIPMSVWLTALNLPGYTSFVGSPNPNFRPPAVAFCSFAMIAFLIEAVNYTKPGRAMLAIAGHLVVFFYVGILGSFLALLHWFGQTPAEGTYILVMTIFTAKFCDMGAFFTGRAVGRIKMAPLLSPAKTIEGSVGGIASSTLFGTLVALVGEATGVMTGVPWYAGATFGLVVGFTALIGDLMESLIKRDCHTKDASDNVPGFGGVLDVVDSVFFSAPVAYLLLSIWRAIGRG